MSRFLPVRTIRAVLLSAVAFFTLSPLLNAQQFDPGTRRQLERVYNQWRKAMREGDMKTWQQSTAKSRIMEVRNQMVSQKQPFPQALFEIPMSPPTLVPLQFADQRVKGDLAQLAYFGKVDFGLGVANIPENLLLLKFIREDGTWKYDNTRFYNLEGQDPLRRELRGKNYGFLKKAEFDLPDQVPAIAERVRTPDFIGQLHLLTIGYEVRITIDGVLVVHAGDTRISPLIPGGLLDGANAIVIEAKRMPEAADLDTELAVAVVAYPDNRAAKPIEVFRWQPAEGEEIPARHNARILVNGAALR